MIDRHPNYQIPWARVRLMAGDRPGTTRLTEFGLATWDGSRWMLADLEPRTWAQLRALPTATLTPGMCCRVTDYAYQQWVWDGAVWRPAQGRAILKDQFGFLAAGGQIAQLSETTSGLFAVPGGCKIPAGMITPHSRLCVQADAYKVGANGQGLFSLLLGTTNSLADSTLVGMTIGSPTGINLLATGAARFGTAPDKFSSRMWQGEGTSSASNNSMVDKTTSVNTNADMWLNIAIVGVNALDTFNLVALQIVLEA